ncbi:undecaprenyldiphospho-muramoylpentapeptide beta-N-acetylglucosaminyltransferase [Corynebacterium sp. ES2775-CONJ]|uniref:undecaprenyldiphospho-muramoylpentapeptide beta-N-acetylglucosaminyltransferase n=1 Tax=Corynebacterium sp. ES2775-CONJ TaxID=2974029 RepID=UPI0021677EE8|nr:undecaprenyldiphospho-muramoylpentapeptide beta-N-acetylglucosaminyltransferase [Corynebacterium sp. ES2775-CONJ]MCS4489015.1 undecaprenyldiphospho-muramoylpentapeptide beta-N-acetylglucosaminyltransferase [Corynebacterium sp. ES2775-CONJ]
MTTKTVNILVAGGGTAGHIEPALAVAGELKSRGYNVIALGSPKGLEKNLIPARGFELRMIPPVPVPRRVNKDLMKLPFRLLDTIRQTRRILTDNDIDVVVGFGGYVAAPAYLAARSLGLPFVVHEANARAGLANKLGQKIGGLGLNAVKGSGMPGRVVGIPIRSSLGSDSDIRAARERGQSLWNLDETRHTLLVTGGSQGAKSLNDAIEQHADELIARGYQILLAHGPNNTAPTARENLVSVPYIEDMAAAYQVADLIVCRSGAMTVAEITAAGVPALYVPLPHGNGEQGLNARAVVDAGAARIIADHELSDRLVDTVDALLRDPDALQRMREAAKISGVGNASHTIADIVADIVARS